MFKRPRYQRRGAGWEIILAGALLFALIWASSRSSEASESHKTVSEGQSSPTASEPLQTPVTPIYGQTTPKPATTTQKGWIGDKRIDLKVIRTNEYTETRGWVGNERVKVKESNDE